MEDSTSFEDIKILFQETDRRIDRRMEETDRRMEETDRRMEETDRQMKETFRSLKEMGRETDRRFRETDKKLGRLGNRLGDFVEGMVRPSLVRLFSDEWGIEVHQTHQDVEGKRHGIALEIDLLVVNDTDVIAVEVKSKLKQADVDEQVERLGKLKRVFPTYKNHRLLGAVAAMVIPENAAEYAMRRGLFVIGPKGEDAVMLNPPTFQPKAW